MKKFIGIFIGMILLGTVSPAFVYAEQPLRKTIPDELPEGYVRKSGSIIKAIDIEIQKLESAPTNTEFTLTRTEASLQGVPKACAKFKEACNKLNEKNKSICSNTTESVVGDEYKMKCSIFKGDKHAEKLHFKDGACVLDACEKDYEIKDNKCVSKDKLAKQAEKDKKKADKEAARAKTALEKEYASDVKSLVDAFNTVVNKIVTKCESEGKTIVDGKCKESETNEGDK